MSVFPPTRHRFETAPFVTRAVFEIARGTCTSLHPLAARAHQILYPTPQILGAQHIPTDTPFVLVFNHYSTARLAAWWGPLVALDVVAAQRTRAPRELQFVMAHEWIYTTRFGRTIKQPLTKWLFDRIARVYGLVTVAPVADGAYTRGQAVVGVRHALELTRREPPALLALAPEGQSGPQAALCEPPPGTGIFLLLLTREKIPLLPLGIYESENTLTLQFGEPFLLREPDAASRADRDRCAVTRVMQTLAALVPPEIRAVYSE